MLGAIATAVVLVVVTTKFLGGAWIGWHSFGEPILAIKRHYEYVAHRLSIQGTASKLHSRPAEVVTHPAVLL